MSMWGGLHVDVMGTRVRFREDTSSMWGGRELDVGDVELILQLMAQLVQLMQQGMQLMLQLMAQLMQLMQQVNFWQKSRSPEVQKFSVNQTACVRPSGPSLRGKIQEGASCGPSRRDLLRAFSEGFTAGLL